MESRESEKRYIEAFDKYADPIFRHCFFRVHDRELARDLTQDAFMRTWDYLRKGNEIENLKAFLYKTATNLIIDHARTRKERLSLDKMREDFDFEIPVEEAAKIDARIDVSFLYKHINRLDRIYREAVIMRFLEELDPGEIADILGESANTVSVRINRGVSKIKEFYRQENND